MLNDFNSFKHFWAEAVKTTCYLQNTVYIRPIINKMPYELWKDKRPNISYFHPFRCQCFILNTWDILGMFDSRSDEGITLGYLETSRAFKVYNFRTLKVEEAIHVKFNHESDLNKSKLDDSFSKLQINDT